MNATFENHPESLDLAQRLLRVLDMITKITEYRMPGDIANQLRLNQIRTLFLLKYEPGIAQKHLAERLSITPAAVSTTVRDMEKLGLVARQPDPTDARQMQLSLSEYGHQVLTEGEEMRCNAVAKMLSALPMEEQRVIVEALERALEITQNGD